MGLEELGDIPEPPTAPYRRTIRRELLQTLVPTADACTLSNEPFLKEPTPGLDATGATVSAARTEASQLLDQQALARGACKPGPFGQVVMC
eukprot:921263-Prorocentrum_minimum.AAC.1